MKKILYSVMALAIAAMTFTACEDVPAPYDTPTGGGGSGSGSLPYASANLNTGWSLVEITAGAQPWSKGSSYAQATGYQKWDGASEKSNKAVEGWLVSPAISTVGYENVKLSFDHTIKYTNNVSGWQANHKVYASTDFNGSTATWKELSFTPVASPYSDWTLYSSGQIQLPAEFVGKETVYIGFWFKAPANASTTWELQSFKMEEGIAQGGEEPTPTPTEDLGTAEAPLTVAKALEIINSYEASGASSGDAYVKGKIVSVQGYNSTYKSITYYISDDGTDAKQLQVYSGKGLNGADFASKNDLKVGATVVVKGQLKKFVKDDKVTPEINQSSTIVSIEGNGGGDEPTPEPSEVKTVTVSEFNAAAESTDVWYQLTGTVKNLKDDDQYGNFDLEDATGSVYVYGLLSEKGGQKKKFKDLVAAKGIKNGSTITIIGNRGSYNDKIEVMNAYFVSIEGGGGGETPDTPTPSGSSELTNGDFETWADGLPTGWKSASTASNATLTQSTDAHGGSYSVNVNGKEGSNVRLACQEITLAAGTYVFAFYTKATTGDAAQVRPGIVPVTAGSVGSYAYGNYVTINNTGWTKVEHEFTLAEETTLCLVVMNPKKSNYSSGKDVLIDDATLTKK